MRRHTRNTSTDDALDLFRQTPMMRLATTDARGDPLLRTVHGVVHQGAIYFHGARKGDKTTAMGRRAVFAAEEIVAEIPSWFVHPERACPATTWFRSAQASGVLRRVQDLDTKAAVLQGLMERYQPAGGYRPIRADDPLYTRAVETTEVVVLAAATLVGKHSLGHDKPAALRTRLLEQLWRHGPPSAAQALMTVLDAAPLDPHPPFLCGPAGVRLRSALTPDHIDAAVALVQHQYWNVGVPAENVRAAMLGSPAWVGAVCDGMLVGTARAISDCGKLAHVMDVAVAPDWRRRGIGTAMMQLLLDHPAVRGTTRVGLRTRDAVGLYSGLGFTPVPAQDGHIHMRKLTAPLASGA